MRVEELVEQAHRELHTKLQPVVQQTQIRDALTRVHGIIAALTSHDSIRATQAKQHIISKVETLRDTAARMAVLTHNEPQLQSCYEDIMYRAEHIVAAHVEQYTPHNTRVLLPLASAEQQHAVRRVGAPVETFTHIPFGYITEPTTEMIGELHHAHAHVLAEKRYCVVQQRTPTSLAWNLEMIGLPEAWETATGKGVSIGIIDTGCDYTHPALCDRFGETKGYDFVQDTEDPQDKNGHGTHVAGIAAGEQFGVATESTLYALRFLDSRGVGYEVDFIRAAEWAIMHNVEILNGSFGSGHASAAEKAVCDALEQQEILFFAAAGNNGTTQYEYPASYPSVTSVGAVNRNQQRAPFSQYNNQVNVSAPGTNIRSSVPGGEDTFSGTSMATPHVTGVCGLLKELHEEPALAREILYDTCIPKQNTDEYGHGIVQAHKAVHAGKLLTKYQEMIA